MITTFNEIIASAVVTIHPVIKVSLVITSYDPITRSLGNISPILEVRPCNISDLPRRYTPPCRTIPVHPNDE